MLIFFPPTFHRNNNLCLLTHGSSNNDIGTMCDDYMNINMLSDLHAMPNYPFTHTAPTFRTISPAIVCVCM